MAIALVLTPLLWAVLVAALRSDRWRPRLVLLGTAMETALVAVALGSPRVAGLDGWLELDPPGRLVLGFTTLLFMMCATYLPGYLAQHPAKPNRAFCTSMMALMGMLALVTEAQHLGLLWMAMEATTLGVAPLLYFHRTPRSLEAMWKYLLIGSVGIALALMGSFLLGYAVLAGGGEPSLLLSDLRASTPLMSTAWLRAALVVLLVGYGTKMGLAPMHTWKPDAYGEAPGIAGTLMAGGLTSGAFLAILRVYGIAVAAGEGDFIRGPLITLGLLSMLVAGVFMLRQRDYKRLLAYSSVEHMGILSVAVGLGGPALLGALLHVMNNALVKGTLFLAAGNIHRRMGSKSVDEVSGMSQTMPRSAGLLVVAFFAVSGLPPFGLFLSELIIVDAAILGERYCVASAFLALLVLAFAGMGRTILALTQGPARAPYIREGWASVLPGAVLLAVVLVLGVVVPPPLASLLDSAVASLEAP